MKNLEYAIVDIETTGGNASHSRITEIAIIIHDGIKWLIAETCKPWKEISVFFALTGITNEMVSDAPIFDTISDKVLNYCLTVSLWLIMSILITLLFVTN
jgi:DNA polymerase-3 subunit epsilon